MARASALSVKDRLQALRREQDEAERQVRWTKERMASVKTRGASRVAHPRWGFDNLPRESSSSAGMMCSSTKRRAEWVDARRESGGRAAVAGGDGPGGTGSTCSTAGGLTSFSSPRDYEGALHPWDGSVFKKNLTQTLRSRLLMKMCWIAMSKEAEVGRLRERLVHRLIKVRL